jgi:hypothetical protein
MADWRPAKTAPKDRLILANFEWPWPTVATWSDTLGCWVAAELQWSVYQGMGDPGFVTEIEPRILGWMNLPEIPHD